MTDASVYVRLLTVPPIAVGAWSMALVLWQSPEYYFYKNCIMHLFILIFINLLILLPTETTTVIITDAVGTGGNQYGFSDEVPILQNPGCEGSESSLRECPGYHLAEATGYYCRTGLFQAGATCIRDNTLQCEDGDLRLGDETSGRTAEGLEYIGGRVEVCESGVFGAICDIGWSKDAAHSICNLIGYKDRGTPLKMMRFFLFFLFSVGEPTFGSHYGVYRGLILFQNVSCVFSDGDYDCSGAAVTDPECTSDRIAGVVCSVTMVPTRGGSVGTYPSFALVMVFFYVIQAMI